MVLDPARTRAGIGMLRAVVVFGTLALIVAPVIWRRGGEFDERAVKTAMYFVLGFAAAVAPLKFFFSRSDQRL